MWAKWSQLLQTLTALTSNKLEFKWIHIEQKLLYEIKGIVTCEALLLYPDLNKRFDIHTDARELQIEAVISQDGKPIAFYSHKLTKPQQQYTLTEN